MLRAFKAFINSEILKAKEITLNEMKSKPPTISLLSSNLSLMFYEKKLTVAELIANYRVISLAFQKEPESPDSPLVEDFDIDAALSLSRDLYGNQFNLARAYFIEKNYEKSLEILESLLVNCHDFSVLFYVYVLFIRVLCSVDRPKDALVKLKTLFDLVSSWQENKAEPETEDVDFRLIETCAKTACSLFSWLKCHFGHVISYEELSSIYPDTSFWLERLPEEDYMFTCLNLVRLAGQAFEENQLVKAQNLLNEMMARALGIPVTNDLNEFVLESQLETLTKDDYFVKSLYSSYLQNKACILFKQGKTHLGGLYMSKSQQFQEDFPEINHIEFIRNVEMNVNCK